MILFHFARLIWHLAVGLATCAFVFPFVQDAARQKHIQRWSSGLLRICGVTVRVVVMPGAEENKPALIVSNHVSWLDIFVLNSVRPCRFVAKSDIRDWPLVGWLCERAGTVFIARGRQRDVRRIFEGLVRSIRAGERVAFFPEGTTAPQGTLLPFHANLFEAAIEAEVPIQPYALRYTDPDGGLHSMVDFIGDTTFLKSLLNVLSSQDFHVEVIALPTIDTKGAHRRELAVQSRSIIANALHDFKAKVQRSCGLCGRPPK
ncbi:MAG: acyl-phosphate glycerol 3-phosphate acyltransferase [Herminiimonas sp.]|nr:acyl-phosphate glycerol 3-phosphate acyltransferase [Herminiimonas sp.]